jgi:hypothetical protein
MAGLKWDIPTGNACFGEGENYITLNISSVK